MVPWPQGPGRKTLPTCVPTEPPPGGTDEAVPGILTAQQPLDRLSHTAPPPWPCPAPGASALLSMDPAHAAPVFPCLAHSMALPGTRLCSHRGWLRALINHSGSSLEPDHRPVSLSAQLPPAISQDIALKPVPSSRLWEFPGELRHCPLHQDPGDLRVGSDLHVHGHLSCAPPLILSLNLWAVSVHHPVPAPPFWGVIKG